MENLSWIGERILEIIVDVKHARKMSNRITKYSKFTIKSHFDPLCPEWFDWEGDVLPESKLRILQTKFVTRLATSLASTRDSSSRHYIIDSVRKRGLEPQFLNACIGMALFLPLFRECLGPRLRTSIKAHWRRKMTLLDQGRIQQQWSQPYNMARGNGVHHQMMLMSGNFLHFDMYNRQN